MRRDEVPIDNISFAPKTASEVSSRWRVASERLLDNSIEVIELGCRSQRNLILSCEGISHFRHYFSQDLEISEHEECGDSHARSNRFFACIDQNCRRADDLRFTHPIFVVVAKNLLRFHYLGQDKYGYTFICHKVFAI